jgi:CubicO group peptidase (beta-lactamase class C family)
MSITLGLVRHGSGRRVIALTAVTALAVSIAGLSPAAAASDSYPRTAVAAQQAIENALASTGATSVTAGLTDISGVLWQGTTGVVDARGAAPQPTTRYGIGSVSKMFATAAVMQLVDAGKVGLDQPVVRYLPQFTMLSPQYRQITVRMLLDHSAGFPGSAYGDGITTAPFDGYAEKALANLARSRLKTTPGGISVYCNDCFTVAGEVVAEVSGMPFTEYVDRNLLAPLGMTDSGYVTKAMPAPGTVARVVSDGRTQPLEVTNIYASGGLMSTPADMLAFARMLMASGQVGETRVLSGGSIAEMGRSQLATTLQPLTRNVWNYGLGWDTVTDMTLESVGVRAWAKGGDTSDFHASLVVAPEAGLAAFVAGAGSFSSGAAEKAAEEILLNALAERGDIPAVPAPLGTDQPPVATPTQDDINGIVGIYLGTPGLGFRMVRGARETLTLELLRGGEWVPNPVPFTFRSDGAWWPDDPRAQSLKPVTGWGRTYLVVSLPNGYGTTYGEQIVGERVQPAGAIAPEWKSRLGQWLFVGEMATSTAWLGTPTTAITRIPGLPGYLNVVGLSPVDARQSNIGSMFLQVPLATGRDLDDLLPVKPGLARMGTVVMVQRDRVAALDAGRNEVTIGKQGYAEWREVDEAVRISVSDAEAWYLYDEDVSLLNYGMKDATGIKAPKDSLLVVFGDSGDVVNVTTRTPR